MEIEIEVRCENCGSVLPASLDYGRRDITINVEICEECLSSEKNESYEEGYEDGKAESGS